MSSTHQYADGTMTALLRRAAGQGWSTYTWCWRETLEPSGWLSQAAVDRKRSEVSVQMWNTEYELQEPVVTGRAINSDAVEWTFDPTRGTVLATELERGWQGEAPVTGNGVYYASGADWAQTVDYTVIATLRCDMCPLRLVAAYRTHRLLWPEMIAKFNDRIATYQGPAAHDHTGALVHDSKLTDSEPNPEASHRPIRYDSGRPRSVI